MIVLRTLWIVPCSEVRGSSTLGISPIAIVRLYITERANYRAFAFVAQLRCANLPVDCGSNLHYLLFLPSPVGKGHYKMSDGVHLSVCASVCRVPRPNSRTERPRKLEIDRIEVHQTSNPWNLFRGQKVKGQGRKVTWCMWVVLANKPRTKGPRNAKLVSRVRHRQLVYTSFKIKGQRAYAINSHAQL